MDQQGTAARQLRNSPSLTSVFPNRGQPRPADQRACMARRQCTSAARGCRKGCSFGRLVWKQRVLKKAKEKRMSRLAISLLVMVAVLCTFSAVALGEEVKHEGTIAKIEGSNLTLKAADAQHEMTIGPTAKITVDGKPGKATDLKVGQKVKVTCNKEGTKLTCTAVDATSAAR
jgi:hypothetical protein